MNFIAASMEARPGFPAQPPPEAGERGISGKVNNVIGIFRSTNAGKSWTRINDDHLQWGSIGTVVGDPRVFGRVYLGTNGRGIASGN
jgi:hypothetical protein